MTKSSLEAYAEAAPQRLKSVYVSCVRALRTVMLRSGLLEVLDRAAASHRPAHFVRALLAVHDLGDMAKLDVPWWPYSASDRLDEYLAALGGQARVFEYGSGASTLWLAKRSGLVVSVEHDPVWHGRVQQLLADSGYAAQLLLREPTADTSLGCLSAKVPGRSFYRYVEAIAEPGTLFDVVVVDGRAREACLDACLPYLKSDAIVVLDNCGRARYQDAIKRTGLSCTKIWGFAPGLPFPHETALLRRH